MFVDYVAAGIGSLLANDDKLRLVLKHLVFLSEEYRDATLQI